MDLTKNHRRHGYGRWLAIVEDPQLELGPVIRGELLLRGVNDGAAGSSKNGDSGPAEMGAPPGRGSYLQRCIILYLLLHSVTNVNIRPAKLHC